MKYPLLPALPLLSAAVLSLAVPGRAVAYDSPNFDADVFSRDGIFLAEDQKTSLLEALAAIASNFSSSNRIDDDLREKALALALRIDPMHYHSRLAHRALSGGNLPNATTYFDSLSVVSETLWTLSNQIAGAPLEPEHQRLAPFLMELSLLTHPDPVDERLVTYAAALPGKNLPWEKFVTLQPDDNRSTARARALREDGLALLARQEKKEDRVARNDPGKGSDPTAPTDAMPAPDADGNGPVGTAVPIEPVIASLNVVSRIEAVETMNAPGVVKFTLRAPTGRAEREMLALQAGAAPATLPLVPTRAGITLESLEIPAALVAAQNWSWPAGTVGELGFSTAIDPPGPLRLVRARGLLPAIILIDSVLRKVPVNDQIVVAGEIDPVSLQVSLPGDAVPAIEAAAAGMRGKYLLIPAAVSEALTAYLVKSGRLELLFTNELVSYTTPAEAIALATSPTPETLAAATLIFREIEAVSDRMPLTDLARNAKVMERLHAILASEPRHLSARAMLEFGSLPESPEMRISVSAGRINALIVPIFEVDDPSVDLNALISKIDPARLELSRLRTEIPLEVRDFHSAAEDFLEKAELYFDLTNKGTSIALQRLRETREARAAFQDLGKSLGLTYEEEEVE